jgi:hypothetical protein
MCLRIGIKITEQPFITNSVMLSSPTDLEGFSLLMDLQTSASELGTRDKNSEDCEKVECRKGNGYYGQIENT